MADFPTLAEIVAAHTWYRPTRLDKPWLTRCVGCNWIGDTRNTRRDGISLHGQHVQAEWVKARTIENADHLAEVVDRYGHEIVIVDAGGGACQSFYDFDPEQFPARLVWIPEVDA